MILALFALGTVLAHAQESERGTLNLPLKAEMTGQITGSLYRLYLTADPSVVWKPAAYAAGIGMELIVGLNQFDVYLLPYLRLELAWFHLDFGYALTLLQPPEGNEVGGLSLGFAVSPKPFELAYGRLGFDLGLDFNLAGYRAASESLAGASLGERVLRAALLSGRYGLGLSYSFALL